MTVRKSKASERARDNAPSKTARKAQSKHRERAETRDAEGPEKTALVILGMHRSGTSALAGSLGLCGAWVGEEHDLTGASIENPKGFWERRDMRAVCDALLHAAGASWCSVAAFETSAIPQVALTEQCRAFRQIVSELDSHGTWVVKEPRLSLLFPVLRTVIPDPVCIHIYRNPLEVARSLQTRNGFCIAEGLALWELYNIKALRASVGLPRLLVSYEALVSHPEETLQKLVRELKVLGVSHLVEPDRETLQDFIEPDLRRQRATSTETLDFLLPSQRELWSQLQSGKALRAEHPLAPNHVVREYLQNLESRWLAKETQQQSTGELLAKLQAQKVRRGELEKEFRAQKARTERLEAKLEERNIAIRRLKSSISWRITAPLRGVHVRLVSRAEKAQAPEYRRQLNALARESRKENARLERELAERDGEMKVHRPSVKALWASTSWRFTALFRGLKLSALWLVRNLSRTAKLAAWLATGQFSRAANAARPYYRKIRGVREHSKDFPKKFGESTNGSLPFVASLSVHSNFRLTCEVLPDMRLNGWCVDNRDRSRIFSIDLLIDGVHFQTIKNGNPRPDLKRKGLSDGYGGLEALLPLTYLDEGSHTISFRLPDGEVLTAALPEAPSSQRIIRASPGNPTLANATSVVVPVYNAADDLAVCIKRLAAYTPDSVDILFIDDASPDLRVAQVLAEGVKHGNMRVLRNDKNAGFAATVNRGLSQTGGNDVVILNSDARVTPGWFEGLLAAASSGPKIATVTAMSDRAGAFSAPNMGNDNDLPPGIDEIMYARAFRRRSLGLYPSVPTGNGFCMFISRACMDEIGVLDDEAFPGGYGEENDFCMRAVRAGWRNIIDDRTYVFHDRSKSFREAKADLLVRHRAVIDDRYPEYKKAIEVFSNGMLTNLARFQARRALIDCGTVSASLPRALYVISTETGGTPQTNADLMAALGDALDTWVLRCDSRKLELHRFRDGVMDKVLQHQLTEPVDPLTHVSFEYDGVVAEWIRNLDVELVHIRHLAWHSLSLPQIAKAAGKKVLFSFHDYYALCPTVKLLDEANTFCEGLCTTSQGQCRPELWPVDAFPPLKDKWVHIWREKFTRILACCDGFVTTSESARARILKAIPGLPANRFWVIPHGRDFTEMRSLREIPVEGEPLRILLPGNINVPKGSGIVRALLKLDISNRLEFHVVGKFRKTDAVLDPRIHLHGEYERENFAEKVAPIRPHLGAIFSIWDETFCHTLSELWSVGLPAIVFDFGTVANRVRESGTGWVMDHTNISALYDAIIRIAHDREEQSAKDEALSRWQGGVGAGSTSRLMAAKYLEIYRTILDKGRKSNGTTRRFGGASGREFLAPRVAVVCSEGKGSEGALALSEGRIYVRTRNQLARDVTFIQMLPSSLLANLRAGEIDGAILQGSTIPQDLASELSCAFHEARVPYVFDLDADLLNAASGNDPAGPDAEHASVLRELFGKATVATVSTPSLHSVYRLLHSSSVLLPDKLSLALWRGLTAERRPDGFVRGLCMGPGAEGANIELARAALEGVAREHPEFRLALIGPTENELRDWAWAERIQAPYDTGSHARFVSWLRSIGGEFDFAIAPLENTPSNAYKSPMTIFQYGGLGLPVLASDVPAYREIARMAPGVETVTNTAEGWTSAISRQVKSRSEDRKNEGLSLRRWVLESQALEPTLSDFDALIPLRGID